MPDERPTHRLTPANRRMFYASTTTIRGFWVLNTREGVTPFCIHDGGEEFRHADWAWDQEAATFPPFPGLRYFRDRTEDEAEAAALTQMEKLVRGGFEIVRDSEEWVDGLASLKDAFLSVPLLDRWPVAAPATLEQTVHLQAA